MEAPQQQKRRQIIGLGAFIGGVVGIAIAGFKVMHTKDVGPASALAALIIFLWMFIGATVGSIVQTFLRVRLEKPLTWEEGNLHKVIRVRDDGSGPDPFVVGHYLAIVVALAVFGLLFAAIGLVYLPVVLQ